MSGQNHGGQPGEAPPSFSLSLAQQAAAARISYALDQGSAISLLCGPGGVGKTTVLRHVAAGRQGHPRPIVCRGLEDADAVLADRPHGDATPGAILVDDAHLAGDGVLARLFDRCRQLPGPVGLVLAGEGRLLTLMSRDHRLEQCVTLRATLPAFTLDESRRLLHGVLDAAGPPANRDAVARCVHEIAAGIPATVRRLADLAEVFVAAHPGHRLLPDDVETIHRRLSLTAA